MFNYDITQKLRVNSLQNKNYTKFVSTTKNDVIEKLIINNYSLSIDHDENSTPLTPEAHAQKETIKQKQLDDIQQAKMLNKLPQNLLINRNDGIRIELSDAYEQDIDINASDYSDIPSFADCKMTIIDETGEKYEIEVTFGEAYGRDIKDLRSIKKQVGKFLEKVDKNVIKELISNNVENICFDTEFDPLDLREHSLDSNGNSIEITDYGYATFVSPDFRPEPRKYSTYTNFTRDDGCKFKIQNISDTQSDLEITTPSGERIHFTLEGDDKDKYNQWQIPKFKKLLNDIPINVLKDLSNEIDTIKFMNKGTNADGVYALGSNVLALKVDEGLFGTASAITLVHELGHAIDNYNDSMQSKKPEFVKKFEEFKNLAQKLGVNEYSLTNPEEFFASTYAYHNIEDKSSSNHIANLDKQIEKYKNSENVEEKRCYEIFEQLKQEVNDIVETTRQQDSSKRKDCNIRAMVKQECSDIIAIMSQYTHCDVLIGQSAELEIIDTICRDDEQFSKTIKLYKEQSKNEKLPNVVQKCYEDMATKAIELRNRIINNK